VNMKETKKRRYIVSTIMYGMILIFKGVNPVAKGKICGPAQGIPLPAAGDP
jgi:hypothetical protein